MPDSQTVFVVDDDEAVRESLAVLLTSTGFKVAVYPTGDVFLDAIHPESHGCVVVDVRMPGMSGLEVQKALAVRNSTLPVIIMTGHGDLPMAVRAMKAGAYDFLEKPFEGNVLAESVRCALASSAGRRQEEGEVAEIKRKLNSLTDRERQVLDELVLGNLNKVIAYKLDISPRTVEVHRARTMEKMQTRNLAHLVRLTLMAGVIPGFTKG